MGGEEEQTAAKSMDAGIESQGCVLIYAECRDVLVCCAQSLMVCWVLLQCEYKKHYV